MKNQDNNALLAHKRRIDAQRRERAIQRKRDEEAARQQQNIRAMHSMFKGN
jgi:hypothetical protein